jgi:hypothetical protein
MISLIVTPRLEEDSGVINIIAFNIAKNELSTY